MVTIYHYDIQNYHDGATREIGEHEGAPVGWTFTPVPTIPYGKYAYFVGPHWIIVNEKPSLPLAPEPTPYGEGPAVI